MKISEIVDKNGVVWSSSYRRESQAIARKYAEQLPEDAHDGGTFEEFNKWWKENVKHSPIDSPLYKEVVLQMEHEYVLPIGGR
jgi:hypothetical protein